MQPYYNPTKWKMTKKITMEDDQKIQNGSQPKSLNSERNTTKTIQNGRQPKQF